MIMSAVSSDREKLAPNTRQQHLFAIHMTEHLCSIGDLVLRKTKRKIRTGTFSANEMIVAHTRSAPGKALKAKKTPQANVAPTGAEKTAL